MARLPLLLLLALLAIADPARAATPMVSAGSLHSLALNADGTVRSWGDDTSGALGVGRNLISASPLAVNGLTGVVAVAAGGGHTLALKADGTVWAWGQNDYGQLGDGSTTARSVPVQVVGLEGAVQVAAGVSYSVARRSDGTVWTWGMNYQGTLGDDGGHRSLARAVPGVSGVAEVAAGAYHVLARKTDGTLLAWGANGSGQLGDGTRSSEYGSRATPMPVSVLSGVTRVSAGGFFSVALKSDGTVWTWGNNDGGELGDGLTVSRATPAQLASVSDIVEISAGYWYTLARARDGRVIAWGSGGGGQMGDGIYHQEPTRPFVIPQLVNVSKLAAGFLHSFALREDGAVYTWGSSGYGQLGTGTLASEGLPILVPGLTDIAGIAPGGAFSVAVRRDGTVITWGDNSQGQLGNGVFTFRASPQAVPGLSNVTAVAAGGVLSLALLADGHVMAWGANTGNQFGDDSVGHSSPIAMGGLAGVAAISAGQWHSLALLGDGTVRSFGSNYRGRLGVGDPETYPRIGVVKDLFGVRQVSAGGGHSLAVRNDGSVWAWGENGEGQLGDGTTTDRSAPVQVQGLSNIVEVRAGPAHSLARAADGTVWAWGRNVEGQLGDGTDVQRNTPVSVRNLRATAIATGRDFSLAIADGETWAWGVNYNGGVGCGDCDPRGTPARIPGAAGLRGISSFVFHVLGLRPDGSVYAWGGGLLGQLGNGTLVDRDQPVVVLHEDGTGSVAGNDWFLDLDPAVASSVSADKVPVFLLNARASGADITADFRPRAQDVGAQAGVFVFALAPAASVKSAAVDELGLRAKVAGKDTPVPCVLAQLDSSGQLVGVSSSNLQPALNTILAAQGQAVSVLNGVPAGNVAGSTFFVGYGSSGSAMIGAGTNRAVATLPGSVQCKPEAPQTGWWWNPLEDGRGFSIERRGANLFFAAFLYDVSGRSTWYVSAGPVSLDGSLYSGDLLGARNGQTLGGAYPGRPALATEGAITLAFNSGSTGTMIWPGGTVPIQRFDIVPQGLASGPAANMPESGWWWNESESGRGFFMEWQKDSLDIAGYMYDDAGNSVWYLTVGTQSADGKTFTGNWWSYGNGQTLTGAWRPNARLSTTVAPLTITFSGPDTAFMTLPNGRSTALTRHRF